MQLLPNGVLRHIYSHPIPNEEEDIGIEILDGKDLLFHDFPPGQYCMDKVYLSDISLLWLAWNDIIYSFRFVVHSFRELMAM